MCDCWLSEDAIFSDQESTPRKQGGAHIRRIGKIQIEVIRVLEIEDLNSIKEAVVKLNGLKVVTSNRVGKKYGFRENKGLLSVFTCREMEVIVGNIQEGRDFSLETDIYFFELQAKRTVSLHFHSKKGFLIVHDVTEEKKLNEAKLDTERKT